MIFDFYLLSGLKFSSRFKNFASIYNYIGYIKKNCKISKIVQVISKTYLIRLIQSKFGSETMNIIYDSETK